MKINTNTLGCLQELFFSDYEKFDLMTLWPIGALSSLFNFALIFFKFAHDVAYIMRLFAFENQQEREVMSIQNSIPHFGPAAILDQKIQIG